VDPARAESYSRSVADETLFQGAARLLVLLHAAAAIVLVGASTHNSLVALGSLRGRPKPRLTRIYAATVLGAYAATFALGSLAYPTYRYHVRGLYFDRYEVWASNLFDIKENFASIGLPLVIGAFLLSRVLEARRDRAVLAGYASFVFLSTIIVWFNVISGLLITMAKGV
jgi:hypothetical protein